MNTKPTTPYTVRLDNDVKAALEREAKLEDRSPAQLATRAIKTMLEAKASKRAALDEALTEADKGTFISSESMQSWVESWGSDAEKPMPEPDIWK